MCWFCNVMSHIRTTLRIYQNLETKENCLRDCVLCEKDINPFKKDTRLFFESNKVQNNFIVYLTDGIKTITMDYHFVKKTH